MDWAEQPRATLVVSQSRHSALIVNTGFLSGVGHGERPAAQVVRHRAAGIRPEF
jgi:hypothetical protein